MKLYEDKPIRNYLKTLWERYHLAITVIGFVILGFVVSVVRLIYHLTLR